MGTEDMRRQELNVFRMRLLGAEVIPVDAGSRTLKDAINEAMRDWVTNVGDTHYILGSVLGPHPFPAMVRDFQAVIGREARAQLLEREGRLPTLLVACVGGGSNAIGLFHAFLGRFRGAHDRRRGGRRGDRDRPPRRAFLRRDGAPRACSTEPAPMSCRTRTARSAPRTPSPPASTIPASDRSTRGCTNRAASSTTRVTDEEAMGAFAELARLEGILPALESAHAFAHYRKLAPCLAPDDLVVINLSGRGDKDVQVASSWFGARSSVG